MTSFFGLGSSNNRRNNNNNNNNNRQRRNINTYPNRNADTIRKWTVMKYPYQNW